MSEEEKKEMGHREMERERENKEKPNKIQRRGIAAANTVIKFSIRKLYYIYLVI